jgi:hypothetical protein
MTTLDAKHVFIILLMYLDKLRFIQTHLHFFCPFIYNAQWEGKKIVLL